MLTPLCLLARKYGCDKFGAKHSYSRWYWDTFQDRRETIRKVVEIVVGEGASLYMWREFFPNATIYGADIEQRRVFCDERIMVYLCDQRKDADVQQLIQHTGPDIDLLIDDGSHNAIDQVDTFLAAMPLLAPGATYVVEDVRFPWSPEDFPDYDVREPILERRRRYDNRLIVVRHRA